MNSNRNMLDIYFWDEYAKIYEQVESGEVEKFTYKNEKGEIHYQFIKRLIPIKVSDIEYYDITTPYGYGGPIVLNCEEGKLDELINDFNNAFLSYCEKNRIVAEFVRFHPIIKNHLTFEKIYDPIFLRNTVGIDLKKEDLFMDEFSSKCRNKVRKAIKRSVSIEFDFNCDTIDCFYDIYISTMNKNNATDYYYFPLDFFIKTINFLKPYVFIVNAKLNEKIISSSMFMYSDEFVHYHFSGTVPDYYKYAADNLILFEVAKWAKEHNKIYLHLGGGYTNSENDSLFKFKKSFTKDTIFDFYVGKRILNNQIYDLLTMENIKKKGEINQNFFPAYRA